MGNSFISDYRDIVDSELILAIRKKWDFKTKSDAIEKLLKDGANINAKCRDAKFSGYTPLHVAVEADDPEILKYLLIVVNADPNIENDRHETPMTLAQSLQKWEMVKILSAHRVKYKKPQTLFVEDKHLRHHNGIPMVNIELMRNLAESSSKPTPVHHPNDFELSQLALAECSTSVDQAQLLPKGWTLLTAEGSEFEDGDYVGVAYWNGDQQQIVVAHWCSCNATDVTKDEWGGFIFDHMVPMINATITFSHKILNLMNDLNKSGLQFQLSFTGHSLGGWLAQIAAFSVKYLIKRGDDVYGIRPFTYDTGYHARTVVFDSPGCREALLEMNSRLPYTLPHCLNALDITAYVSAPNRVNTCNTHLGMVYRIFVDLTCAEQKSDKYNLASHSMERIARCFDPNSGHVKLDERGQLKIQKVVQWPKIRTDGRVEESERFYKWASKLNEYHPHPITTTFKDKIRYETRDFNRTEFEMRFHCSDNRSDIYKRYYETQSRDYLESIKQNLLKFDTGLSYLSDFLKSRERVLHVTHRVPFAGVLIIYQELQCIHYPSEDVLFFALKHLLSFESDFSCFKDFSKFDLLIIECESDSEIQQFFHIYYPRLLPALPKCKIILINDRESKFDLETKGPGPKQVLAYTTKIDRMSIMEIVNYRLVEFQGKTVIFKSLIAMTDFKTLYEYVDALIKWGGRNKIKVGNELPFSHSLIDIQRTLTPIPIAVDDVCFKDSKVDIFAISDISIDELRPFVSPDETICLHEHFGVNENCRFVILDSNDANYAQFQYLCDIQQKTNVHWLQRVKFAVDFDFSSRYDEIIWRHTHGSFGELKFETDRMKGWAVDYQKVGGWGSSVNVEDVKGRVVAICGRAGLGKSTLLAQLALRTKENDPYTFVIPINLTTCVNTMDEMQSANGGKQSSSINQEMVIQLLIEVLNLKSDFEIELLRYDLTSGNYSSEVMVFIDGFDEIPANYKRTVVKMVQILKSLKIKQIWLSCRPISIREVEIQNLCDAAYTLDELTEENQLQLMSVHCWGQSDDDLNNCLLRLNKNIPLTPLLVEMLVELNKQIVCSEKQLTKVATIYDSFIKKVQLDNPTVVDSHKSMAVLTLFPGDCAWLLPEWAQETAIEVVNKDHEGFAFLDGVLNGAPQFIHCTFAEYLSAQWFIEILNSASATYKPLEDSENLVSDTPKEVEMSKVELSKYNEVYDRLNQDFESLRSKRIFEFFVEDVLHGENSVARHVCKVNLQDENFVSILKVYTDDEKRFKRLISSDERCQLLHFAVKCGYCNLVKRMIKCGADFTRRHCFEHTPLYYAVRNQDEHVVQTLLETVRERYGLTAFENIPEVKEDLLIHLSAYLNDSKIAQKLLSRFKSMLINSVNKIKDTPLHVAASFGSESVVDLLITEGAEIDPINVYTHTPLYLACEQGHLNIVRSLVRAGANPNNKPSPFHCAVNKCRLKIVEFLMSKVSDINMRDECFSDNTALHLAVEKGNADMVKCLLSSDSIDVKVTNALGITPLTLAERCRNWLIEKLFKEHVALKERGSKHKETSEPQAGCSSEGAALRSKLALDTRLELSIEEKAEKSRAKQLSEIVDSNVESLSYGYSDRYKSKLKTKYKCPAE